MPIVNACVSLRQHTLQHTSNLFLITFLLFVNFFIELIFLFAAAISGEEIVYHNFVDVCVAVATPKGLVVPVIRNTDQMSFAEIERSIAELGNAYQIVWLLFFLFFFFGFIFLTLCV